MFFRTLLSPIILAPPHLLLWLGVMLELIQIKSCQRSRARGVFAAPIRQNREVVGGLVCFEASADDFVRAQCHHRFLSIQKGIDVTGLIHGFAASDWIRARNTARAILIKQARRHNPFIAYSDLVAQLPIALEAHDSRLSALLDEISTSEYDQGRGFLTALVVHKNGSVIPGPGFFEMARKNGQEFEDNDRFFIDSYNEVTRYWRANPQDA